MALAPRPNPGVVTLSVGGLHVRQAAQWAQAWARPDSHRGRRSPKPGQHDSWTETGSGWVTGQLRPQGPPVLTVELLSHLQARDCGLGHPPGAIWGDSETKWTQVRSQGLHAHSPCFPVRVPCCPSCVWGSGSPAAGLPGHAAVPTSPWGAPRRPFQEVQHPPLCSPGNFWSVTCKLARRRRRPRSV